MSKLSPEQFAQVEQWASEGANLNQIQDRLKAEFNITLTYMDARLLMLDIGVKIKDKPKEVPKAAEPEALPNVAGAAAGTPGALNVSMDQIALPGALASGNVSFSDGQSTTWLFDETQQLGLGKLPPGYKPPAADIPVFNEKLELLLRQAGLL